MFQKASIKLTGVYLAIIMMISLFFSLAIYNLSVNELDRGLRGEPNNQLRNLDPMNNRMPSEFRIQFIQDLEDRYTEAKAHVLSQLLFINIVILVGGGLLSYYLALRTLRPIEDAHQAQTRFTADASHELRTPITAMRTENEVALLNPKLTLSQAKKQLQSNIEELEKLTTLTEGLLRLASGGKDGLAISRVSSAAVLSQAISRVLPIAESKHILINQVDAPDFTCSADRASLVEALVIILDNAVKYSPEKTEVSVSVRKEQKYIVFTIADQGIGIKSEDIKHVFDRFYRADNARSKQNAEGYGLGLAIAKSIVDIHDGSIDVKSQPGNGSTFSIKIPA